MIKNVFLVLIFSMTVHADIQGVLFEKGRKVPLKGVNVYAPLENLQAVTNDSGEFVLKTTLDIVNIKINSSLYIAFDGTVQSQSENRIYLEKKPVRKALGLTVEDSNYKKDQSVKSLSRKQILEMPGANGDAVKAVQNLPGINRSQGFSSQVVIQGSAPKDTSYDFEGHEIPLVFHFGGLSSVVMPEAVEKVDYFSAGFQADHSRALGGIISLTARDPEIIERPYKGLFYLDNLSAGGLFESKVNDKISFLISGRYSYVGAFVKSVLKNNEALDLTVAPEFYDLTGVFKYQLADNEKLKISFLNSKDKLGFVFKEPLKQDPSLRGEFSNEVYFYRIIPAWEKQIDGDNLINISIGYGHDQIDAEFSDKYFKLDSQSLSTRSFWDHKLNSTMSFHTGWDNSYQKGDVKIRLPVRSSSGGISNPISSGEMREADITNKSNNVGFFSQLDYQWSDQLKLIPGIRYDYFSTTKESFINPRFASVFKQDSTLSYKLGTGTYVQNPEPQESSEDFGNPDIKSPKALHLSVGFDKILKEEKNEGQTLGMNLFYKKYSDLIISSSNKTVRNGVEIPEIYNNDGTGYSVGLENQWKYQLEAFQLTLSYTWSKSIRSSSRTAEYNFEYDQTHNLNIISSYEFENNWKVSSRYRYVTGNPFTPVVGSVYDSDNETYFPIRGEIYSERNNPFSQLDFRIDKKIILDEETWTFYLDIQNVLNMKNPEGYQYSYDYAVKKDITGLPLIPSIGIKGEF